MQGLSPQRLYAVRARLTLYEGLLLVLRLQPELGLARLHAGLTEARACRDISVLIGHSVIARLEGSRGEFAKAFAELAEAERLMHIWDVPPIYYLAMLTLVKCELWLAQGRTDLAGAWLTRLGQTYNGEQAAAPPNSTRKCPCTSNCSKPCWSRCRTSRCWPRGVSMPCSSMGRRVVGRCSA